MELPEDPLDSARAVIARLFQYTGIGSLVLFLATRDWRFLALTGAAWTLWGVMRWLVDGVVTPFSNMVGNLLTGASADGTVNPPVVAMSIDEETALLERHLTEEHPRHQRILAGIRLAEIYRTHERNDVKADALIARLIELFPDAPELRFVRSTRP